MSKYSLYFFDDVVREIFDEFKTTPNLIEYEDERIHISYPNIMIVKGDDILSLKKEPVGQIFRILCNGELIGVLKYTSETTYKKLQVIIDTEKSNLIDYFSSFRTLLRMIKKLGIDKEEIYTPKNRLYTYLRVTSPNTSYSSYSSTSKVSSSTKSTTITVSTPKVICGYLN